MAHLCDTLQIPQTPQPRDVGPLIKPTQPHQKKKTKPKKQESEQKQVNSVKSGGGLPPGARQEVRGVRAAPTAGRVTPAGASGGPSEREAGTSRSWLCPVTAAFPKEKPGTGSGYAQAPAAGEAAPKGDPRQPPRPAPAPAPGRR